MKNKKHDNPKPIRIAIGNLQEIKGEKLSPCELSDYDQHRHVSFSPSRSIRFSYNEHIINFGVIKDIPFNRRKSNQTGTSGTSDEGKAKTFNHYCQRNERLMGRWHGKARIYQINENHWYRLVILTEVIKNLKYLTKYIIILMIWLLPLLI